MRGSEDQFLFAGSSVPMILLWIEYWQLRLSYMRGGYDAFERTIASLTRRKLIEVKKGALIPLEGRYSYKTLAGGKWTIESKHRGESLSMPDGSVITMLGVRWDVYAAPAESWDAFQTKLSKDPAQTSANYFTLYGMRVDAFDHPHVKLLDAGWDRAGITQDDVVDRLGATATGNGKSNETTPIKSCGRKQSRKRAKPAQKQSTTPTIEMVKAHGLCAANMSLRAIRAALVKEYGEKRIPSSPTTIKKWIDIAESFLNPKAKSARARQKLPADRRGQSVVSDD